MTRLLSLLFPYSNRTIAALKPEQRKREYIGLHLFEATMKGGRG